MVRKEFDYVLNSDDAGYVKRYNAIRTEIIESAIMIVYEAVQNLTYALPKYDTGRIEYALTSIDVMKSPMNEHEVQCLEQYSSEKYDYNRSQNYNDSYKFGGIFQLKNAVHCGDANVWNYALNRMSKKFIDPALNKRTDEWYVMPDQADAIKVPYNDALRKKAEAIADEYIAKINEQTKASNEQSKRYRTCDKCGTEFHLLKSKNMHYSRCNGVNRGYVYPKAPAGEKETEW